MVMSEDWYLSVWVLPASMQHKVTNKIVSVKGLVHCVAIICVIVFICVTMIVVVRFYIVCAHAVPMSGPLLAL